MLRRCALTATSSQFAARQTKHCALTGQSDESRINDRLLYRGYSIAATCVPVGLLAGAGQFAQSQKLAGEEEADSEVFDKDLILSFFFLAFDFSS